MVWDFANKNALIPRKVKLSFSLHLFVQKSPGTAEKGGRSRLCSPGSATDGLPQRTQHHWGKCVYVCALTYLYERDNLGSEGICS